MDIKHFSVDYSLSTAHGQTPALAAEQEDRYWLFAAVLCDCQNISVLGMNNSSLEILGKHKHCMNVSLLNMEDGEQFQSSSTFTFPQGDPV